MKERILIGIPCIVNPHVIKETVQAILYKPNVHIILIDNGADHDVKDLLAHYATYENVNVWNNDKNEFVNKAWNQLMRYFLGSELHDRLIIMNSDLVMHINWNIILDMMWKEGPDLILTPTLVDDKTEMFRSSYRTKEKVDSPNPAGVFITLNKRQCELVHPIPEEIKVWFGDTWIYQILDAFTYKVFAPKSLKAFHHTSESIKRVPGVYEIIEEDKIAWHDIVEPKMQKLIQTLKNKNL